MCAWRGKKYSLCEEAITTTVGPSGGSAPGHHGPFTASLAEGWSEGTISSLPFPRALSSWAALPLSPAASGCSLHLGQFLFLPYAKHPLQSTECPGNSGKMGVRVSVKNQTEGLKTVKDGVENETDGHYEVDGEESLAIGEGQEALTRCKAASEDVLVGAAQPLPRRLEAASRAGRHLVGMLAG